MGPPSSGEWNDTCKTWVTSCRLRSNRKVVALELRAVPGDGDSRRRGLNIGFLAAPLQPAQRRTLED
jgi:hypothetical protein